MTRKIVRSLLIHLFCVWLLLSLNQVLPYIYRVHVYGDYLFGTDNLPVTPWAYFLLLYQGSNAWHFFSLLLFYIPLVELSYWFIIKSNPIGKAILSSVGTGLIAALSFWLPWNQTAFGNDPFSPLYSFLIFSAYAFIYGIGRKYIYERAHRKALQLQRVENELNALKAQLNPHFLFNSLNYVYGTALKEGAAGTAEAISTISDMMRYTLLATKENFVPLKDELHFVDNYLALQRARISEEEAIKVETFVGASPEPLKIAPMLLLPFIENAFKYGISIDYPSRLKIRIGITGSRLQMEVENRIIEERTEVKGNNTGISNTRKRLDLLYPGKYTLRFGEVESVYKVFFQIQLS